MKQPDEKLAVVEEYARLAPAYDQKWPFYIQATTAATIAELPRLSNEEILDVGCGTGVLLDKVMREFPAVSLAGVDPVTEMLAIARERVGEKADLREAWAENLPFGDKSFDIVVSCNMFHYIQDPVVALQQIRRVLRPAGKLIITDWCDDFLACRLCGWWLNLFGASRIQVYRQRECLQLLEDAGFRDPTIKAFKVNWLWGLMTATVANPPD